MGNEGILKVKPICMKVVKESKKTQTYYLIREINAFIVVKGFDHITRSCGYEGSLIKPCDAHRSAEHCSVCDSNLCNSSINVFLNYKFLLLPLICIGRMMENYV